MMSNDTLTISDVRERATITVEEAAKLLGISRGVAYRAARSDELPAYRIGGRLLVSVPALLAQLGAVDSAA